MADNLAIGPRTRKGVFPYAQGAGIEQSGSIEIDGLRQVAVRNIDPGGLSCSATLDEAIRRKLLKSDIDREQVALFRDMRNALVAELQAIADLRQAFIKSLDVTAKIVERVRPWRRGWKRRALPE